MKTILTILIMLTLISCAKKENYTVETINGIKTFRNKNIPADSSLRITPKELFTISCFYQPDDSSKVIKSFYDFDLDSRGNIYILDNKQCMIFKFDKTGKFVKSFGKKGKGPGESAVSICMTVLNDTIIYDDYNAKQFLRYDTDGNFLGKINYPAYGSSEIDLFKAVDPTTIVGYNCFYDETKEGYFITYDLIAMDSKFTKKGDLLKQKIKYSEESYNYYDILLTSFAHSPTEIFVAEKSNHNYRINVFGSDGKQHYAITKNYAQIKYSDEELKAFDSKFKENEFVSKNKSKIKSAINQLEFDKDGRLWVFASVARNSKNQFDMLADIYKDGIFLNQVKLDIAKSTDYVNYDHVIRLAQDRIFYINHEEQCIKVYSY